MLVVQLADLDRVALAKLRPQRLGFPASVVGDHCVRGVEDRLCRAVVLLEPDNVRVLEVVLELQDVADVGSAELVDRLIWVADHRQVPVLPRQQLQPAVLGVVGVLVLVDQHMPEPRGVPLANFGE